MDILISSKNKHHCLAYALPVRSVTEASPTSLCRGAQIMMPYQSILVQIDPSPQCPGLA